MAKIASDKPVVTILTLLAASVAIIVGGIVTITNPQTLTFHQYIQDIAFMAGALGLGSGIGRGIDSYGQTSRRRKRASPDRRRDHRDSDDAPTPPPATTRRPLRAWSRQPRDWLTAPRTGWPRPHGYQPPVIQSGGSLTVLRHDVQRNVATSDRFLG